MVGGVGIGGNLNVGADINFKGSLYQNGSLFTSGSGGSVRSTTTSTAPLNPTIGDIWYYTNTDVIYRYTNDGSTSFWLDVNGPAYVVSTGTLNVSQLKINGKQAANGPAFRAYVATGQTILSNGAQQKVTFGNETFDTDGCFTSSRFTPTVEGYYQLNSTVRMAGTSGTGEYMITIWRNGSEHSRGSNGSGVEIGSNFYALQVSDIVYANGTTDYFEIYVQQGSGGNRDTTTGTNISYFSGVMARGA